MAKSKNNRDFNLPPLEIVEEKLAAANGTQDEAFLRLLRALHDDREIPATALSRLIGKSTQTVWRYIDRIRRGDLPSSLDREAPAGPEAAGIRSCALLELIEGIPAASLADWVSGYRARLGTFLPGRPMVAITVNLAQAFGHDCDATPCLGTMQFDPVSTPRSKRHRLESQRITCEVSVYPDPKENQGHVLNRLHFAGYDLRCFARPIFRMAVDVDHNPTGSLLILYDREDRTRRARSKTQIDYLMPVIGQTLRGAVRRYRSGDSGSGTGLDRLRLFADEHGLSPRESEVLYRRICGMPRRQIGDALSIAESTVSGYLQSIREKTGLSSILEINKTLFDIPGVTVQRTEKRERIPL